jgi:hypothetical protein
MRLWKINCMENEFPGMWQRWFLNQCVAVGWYGEWGYKLSGDTDGGQGWSRARKILREIAVGDNIVVALRNHRVGRLGEVTSKTVSDNDWRPLVPPSTQLPDGEMGRRILVRWDMMVGPDNREMVVALPPEAQFTLGELRPTLSEIRSTSLDALKKVMSDQSNWVGLWSHFDYERSLSGYIAAYPHKLEDGLLPYPNSKIRELVFNDQSRLDVILQDRFGVPVIVECKQGQPSVANLDQLRGYMANLRKETKQDRIRGILVHGGARKLHRDIDRAARQSPVIEIVQYNLALEFSACN